MKYILNINTTKEEADAEKGLGHLQELTVRPVTLVIKNEAINGKAIKDIRPLVNRNFVISRIRYHEGNKETELVNSGTILHLDDEILIISNPIDIEAITVFFGKQVEVEWEQVSKNLISRRILITKPELNGKTLSQLKIRNNFGANITRINRSGVDLVAAPSLQLQMGDRVTVVGSELAVGHAEKVLGNSMKRLNHPNLIPIFIGIALGCILGSIPFMFPGIPQPVKLGLAGGPLIVSILISRFGPQYKMITYTTMSANLMVREIGISLFLACVGLGAGKGFIETVVNEGGYVWIGYGAIITVIPLLITGLIGRYGCKLNYYTLIGVLSGANTNPPALAYSNDLTSCDAPAVGYATSGQSPWPCGDHRYAAVFAECGYGGDGTDGGCVTSGCCRAPGTGERSECGTGSFKCTGREKSWLCLQQCTCGIFKTDGLLWLSVCISLRQIWRTL